MKNSQLLELPGILAIVSGPPQVEISETIGLIQETHVNNCKSELNITVRILLLLICKVDMDVNVAAVHKQYECQMSYFSFLTGEV